MNTVPKVVTVFGSSAPQPGTADYESARMLGRLLADAHYTVQTGGYSGIMAETISATHVQKKPSTRR